MQYLLRSIRGKYGRAAGTKWCDMDKLLSQVVKAKRSPYQIGGLVFSEYGNLGGNRSSNCKSA